MFVRWLVLFAGLLLPAAAAGASPEKSGGILRAYGPGGPHHALKECAELFREKHGVSVEVYKASPAEMAHKLSEDGDIYFSGAEYMLDDFARENPGVLDMLSVEKLHPRRIGLVVREGNPLKIKGLECLQQDGIDLLVVNLENMAQFYAPHHNQKRNLRRLVNTGQEGVGLWRSSPELDVWVTYRSWHVMLGDESEFIDIPDDRALRFTPVALTNRTANRQAAMQFIAFLRSPEARRIFVEHGWD
jgi:accessory colonization factor AcfC